MRSKSNIVRHSKSGRFYKVLGPSKNASTGVDEIAYAPLYECEHALFTRPAAEFYEVYPGGIPRYQEVTLEQYVIARRAQGDRFASGGPVTLNITVNAQVEPARRSVAAIADAIRHSADSLRRSAAGDRAQEGADKPFNAHRQGCI